MVTLTLQRQEAETIIDLLEACEPKENILRWELAADIREKIGAVPYQREGVSEAELESRRAKLTEAYSAVGWDVPDWVTPGEQREAERASETNPI